MCAVLETSQDAESYVAVARDEAAAIAEEEVESCRRIGEHGLALIEAAGRTKNDQPVNVLTHCNAGWLACVEYGTATAPIYAAHHRGHVAVRLHLLPAGRERL